MGVPRTRGDEPVQKPISQLRYPPPASMPINTFKTHHLPTSVPAIPAHAGMNRCGESALAVKPCVPRTRGDEPGCALSYQLIGMRSPHTRG